MRRLLSDEGFVEELVAEIGSHSLKATTLSWDAKKGLPQDTRRILGYHRLPGDRSVATYSRDELAGPLRLYQEMLKEISGGSFVPDASRSGYVSSSSQLRSRSPSSSSSRSSSVSSSSSSSGSSLDDDVDVPVAGDMVLNKASGIVHLVCAESRTEFGRCLPRRRVAVKDGSSDLRLCKGCF